MSGAPPTFLTSLREIARFAPVRPAFAAGVRAAVASIVPSVLALSIGRPELTWAGLAGFVTAMVDKSGAYRTRARAMAWVALAGVPLTVLAALTGDSLVPAVLTAGLAATALGLARVYGADASSVGASVLVLTLASLGRPHAALAPALLRGGAVLAGVAWAAALSLLLWPVRLYRPARLAIARALGSLSAYTGELARLAPRPLADPASASEEAIAAALRRHRAAVRTALEEARATLVASRRGRRGETGRGARLVVVLESADQLFARILALSELRAGWSSRAGGSSAAGAVAAALTALAQALGQTARAVESERRHAPIAVPRFDLDALTRPATAASPDDDPPDSADERTLAAELLVRARASVQEAATSATSLSDEPPPAPGAPLASPDVEHPEPWLATLRAQLTLRSVQLRHALRNGATAATAVALTHALHLSHGYWVTISAAAILQPQIPATLNKAVQRVLGTVLGGLLAAVLAAAVHDPRAMLVVVFVLAVVSVALFPINYGLFSIFLTPTFVLLAEVSVREARLVEVRILNTLLGGALALSAVRLLWPVSERDEFPRAAQAALDACRAFFRLAIAIPPAPDAAQTAARRELGIALNNAEASLQRWLAEPQRTGAALEAPMALLVYARGFSAASVVLAALPPPPPLDMDAAAREAAFAGAIDGALAALATAARTGRPPAPLPDAVQLPVPGGPPQRRARLARLVRQVTVMHDAVTRWLSVGAARTTRTGAHPPIAAPLTP